MQILNAMQIWRDSVEQSPTEILLIQRRIAIWKINGKKKNYLVFQSF